MAKLPPEGLLEQSLEPTALTTWEAFVAALGAVVTGPRTSFRLEPDRRMAQLRADTEAQLDDLVTALHSRHSILAHAGAPRVAYRETIRRKAQVEAAHRVGEGFARVRLGFEPQRRGRGYAFQNRAAARRVPKAMVAWVERGLESARQEGLLDGGPVTDFKAVLLDGDCQGTSSDGEAFEGAARSAFQRLRDGGAGGAGTGDGGRGESARGIRRRHHRRSEQPPQHDQGRRREPKRGNRRHVRNAAGLPVRLRIRAAVVHARIGQRGGDVPSLPGSGRRR